MNKPCAAACDQNREPIESVLSQFVEGRSRVLEIGSGTGQHAVYFGARFPWLSWQTSDLLEHHAGINAWIDDSGLDNVLAPIELDVSAEWPTQQYDLVFTANTLHIMDDVEADAFISRVSGCMHAASYLLVYGPFNYQGRYTSQSNARFDVWLKQRDPASGIKNFDWLRDRAKLSGLECAHDFAMPANNRMLVWRLQDGDKGR